MARTRIPSLSAAPRSALSTREKAWRRIARDVLLVIGFAVAFFILQRLTFLLRFPPYERTTLWAPGALTFSALLISPTAGWWRFYVGLCIAAYAAYRNDAEISGPLALLSAQFHFLTTGIGAWATRRLTNQAPFATVASMFVFVLAAGVLVPVATSAPGDLLRWLQGNSDAWPTAIRSVLGVSLGMLVATPALTTSIVQGSDWLYSAGPRERLEGIALATCLLLVGWWVFNTSTDSTGIPALVYAPIPFLLWAALRFEVAGASWALLAIAYLSTWNAINGRGPFVGGSRDDHVLQLQFFLMAISLPLLFMAAGVGERRRAHAMLVREMEDRRRIEEGLRHASRVAVLSEFTASIAHEINQPLGAILCNTDAAELLLEDPSPPLDEIRRILIDIRNDDLRASEVIRSLRTLLRRGEVERLPVEVNRLVQDVIHILRAESERRSIDLRVELAGTEPIVMGERVHLQQVLLNLMLNAMDAMQDISEEKKLSISSVQRGEEVVISVIDRGPGVPPDQIPNLFERFFSTKKDGMGMGLAISRSLVEEHGGRIWVENAPDRGAIFRFSLPTRTPHADEPANRAQEWTKELIR
jgi:signal transduction histidine kinase